MSCLPFICNLYSLCLCVWMYKDYAMKTSRLVFVGRQSSNLDGGACHCIIVQPTTVPAKTKKTIAKDLVTQMHAPAHLASLTTTPSSLAPKNLFQQIRAKKSLLETTDEGSAIVTFIESGSERANETPGRPFPEEASSILTKGGQKALVAIV
jgi:hypothetical protein